MNIDRISAAEFRRRQGLEPAVANEKPQIRLPKKREPNKTEAEWTRRCQSEFPPAYYRVDYEPFSIHLPSGTKYTPDVVVFDLLTGGVRCYEVKGAHLHGNAANSIRAFKEARAFLPFWKFGFAQLVKGEWRIAE